MKKALLFMAALAAVLCSALPQAAALMSVTVPEMKMTAEIPDGWMVFTRQTKADDPNLSAVGIDKKTLDDTLYSASIYLNALKLEGGGYTEITAAMTEDAESKKVFDFNTLAESDVKKYGEEAAKVQKVKEQGLAAAEVSVYQHRQCRFAVMRLKTEPDGLELRGLGYMTVVNGQTVSIAIKTRSGVILPEQEGILRAFIDSISFSEIKTRPAANDTVWTDLLKGAGIAIVAGALLGMRGRNRRRKAEEEEAEKRRLADIERKIRENRKGVQPVEYIEEKKQDNNKNTKA